MLDAKISELDRVLLGLDGLARDLKLKIKLQESEIGARHVTHERQYDRLARIFCRKEFSARRLGRATQPSEEVQLERRVGGKEQKVRFGLEVMFFSAAEIGVPLHLREQTGTRDGNLGARGIDALRCELQIIVLLERCADELLQLRVLEDLPPRKIGIGCCLSLRLGVFAQITESRGRLNDGPMVVWAHPASSAEAQGHHRRHECCDLLHRLAPLHFLRANTSRGHFNPPPLEWEPPARFPERALCRRLTISPPSKRSQARRRFRSRWRLASRRLRQCP